MNTEYECGTSAKVIPFDEMPEEWKKEQIEMEKLIEERTMYVGNKVKIIQGEYKKQFENKIVVVKNRRLTPWCWMCEVKFGIFGLSFDIPEYELKKIK